MAGQIPDLHSLNSWEDAFNHPLPVVRRLEQQLRKNIDENRTKLRSLVGASYRDLLETAERIIEMDQQMEAAEANLGDIGRRCNARTIERISDNGARMRKTLNARQEGKHSAMAQTKVLQNTLTMLLRIVKNGGDALQASKLLVLSRLLLKSVSGSHDAPATLEDLRRKLASLRKKLLAYITSAMVKLSEDKSWHVNALCAYALVTSSTPKDALRYFLQVRYEQLDNQSESLSETDMLSMLDLYSQTLLDTRDLFPRRFSESLMQLAKSPLLRDEQVRSLSELNLDIYGQWIAEDVRTFTPWLRHDQLTSTEVADAVEAWSKQAQECLLRAVEESLEKEDDASVVAILRPKVLSKYMSLSGKLRDGQHSKTIHALRKIFLRKLQALAASAAVFGEMDFGSHQGTAGAEQNSGDLQSMWDLAMGDMELSQGALDFRRSIVKTRNSRTAVVQAAGKRLDDWVERIDTISDLIDNMRQEKWDDDLDLELDDLEDSTALIRALNKDDPAQLQDSLKNAVAITLKDLGSMTTSDAAKRDPALPIRIWREVNQRHRTLASRLSVPSNEVSLIALYRSLAQSVSKLALEAYLRSLAKQTPVAVDLWDGSPPLPVQPSPAVFRLLKALHESMSSAGSDLWNQHATRELKAHVLHSLGTKLDAESFTKHVADPSLANGHTRDDDEGGDGETLRNGIGQVEDPRRNLLAQSLFDIQYLQRVFTTKVESENRMADLSSVAGTISAEAKLDKPSMERLEKNANEYWRRTYLLFGLLAGS